METKRVRNSLRCEGFLESDLLPRRTGSEHDAKVMLVNIGIDPDRVARTDMPLVEFLIVGGNDDVGRVW